MQWLENLQLISIMSIIGKILEKFVKNHLVDFFESNELFYNLQFGFHANRSTSDAVFYLVDEILKSRNKGLYTSTAFLDLIKVFNCIDQEILLCKLEHYGIRDICMNGLGIF